MSVLKVLRHRGEILPAEVLMDGTYRILKSLRGVILLSALPALCCAPLFLLGCIASSETTITLAGVEADAPLSQPPVFVADQPKRGKLELSAAYFSNVESSIDGRIQGSLPSAIAGADSLFPPGVGAISWNRSHGTALLNLQYMASGTLALTGGLSYGWGTEGGLWGGNFGLGLVTADEHVGFRADVGVLIQTVSQKALTYVTTKIVDYGGTETITSALFLDNTRSTAYEIYGSLTLNTSFRSSLLNGFVNVAITHQTIADFVPEDQISSGVGGGTVIVNDQRADLGASLFIVTPGVMVRLGNSNMVLAGVRIVSVFDAPEFKSGATLSPFLQLHFIFDPGS